MRSYRVMGELADRSELRFSVCRNKRWALFGESIIIASTVDAEETADKRRVSKSSVRAESSQDGQPMS